MSKRFLIWIFVLVTCTVAIALYAGALAGSYRLNRGIRIATGDNDTEAISISMDYNTVSDINGVTYTIDLGSPHSFLADTTLMRLQMNGSYPDSINAFIYTTCPDETARMFDTKHRQQLSFTSADPDSENRTAVIRDAEFLTYPGCSENIIGVDILDHFIVEYLSGQHELRLLKSTPDDYAGFAKISKSSLSAADGFTHANRYYIRLAANHTDYKSFRIDSGREMAYIYILLPADEA